MLCNEKSADKAGLFLTVSKINILSEGLSLIYVHYCTMYSVHYALYIVHPTIYQMTYLLCVLFNSSVQHINCPKGTVSGFCIPLFYLVTTF